MDSNLLATLKKLRLSGLANTLEIRLHEASTSSLSHREFLELLLQDEVLLRNDRLISRRITWLDSVIRNDLKNSTLVTTHRSRRTRYMTWRRASTFAIVGCSLGRTSGNGKKSPLSSAGALRHTLWHDRLLSIDLRHGEGLPPG